VTTQQRGLIRFQGFRDFAALCVFEDPNGNELLREMENPQHDQFEPNRLPEDQQARGRRALNRITQWIRSEVRKVAGPPEAGGPTMLSELSAYLPDWQPDDKFEDDGSDESPEPDTEKEPGFGERVTLRLKPIRVPVSSAPDTTAAEDEDGEGEDAGNVGGGGTGENDGHGGDGAGPGEGEGHGGVGGRGGSKSRRSVPVSGVRLLPIAGKDNCYRLSFRAEAGVQGVVRLELQEAGDSSPIRRDDVQVLATGGAETTLDAVPLDSNVGRTVLTITADAPIGGRAWRLSATEVDEP